MRPFGIGEGLRKGHFISPGVDQTDQIMTKYVHRFEFTEGDLRAKHERVRPGVETFRFGGAQGSEDENCIRVVPAEVGNAPKPTVHVFGDRGMPTIRVLLVLSPEIGPQMGITSKYLPLRRVLCSGSHRESEHQTGCEQEFLHFEILSNKSSAPTRAVG